MRKPKLNPTQGPKSQNSKNSLNNRLDALKIENFENWRTNKWLGGWRVNATTINNG